MKKILSILFLVLFGLFGVVNDGWSDVIYSETFGTTATSNTDWTKYTGWSNTITPNITSSNSWKVGSADKCNISGSSGNCNAYSGTSGATLIFNFGNISTYNNVVLSFNYYNNRAGGNVRTITCQISGDGGKNWSSNILTLNTTNGWCSTTIVYNILSTYTSNFSVKFTNTAGNTSRIDDIILTGETSVYTITAQSNNNDYGTVSLTNNVITGSPNDGYRYADPAYSVSPANSATVSQNGNEFTVTPSANTIVTINFEAIPPIPTIDIAVWDTNAVYLNIENFEAISASIEGHGGNNIADDLFFSKYFEAAGNVKLWAIYNGTDHDISLENIKVLVSSNGNGWGYSGATPNATAAKYELNLCGRKRSGYISVGEEIIIYNPGHETKDNQIIACAEDSGVVFSEWYVNTNNVSNFSGDDGLLLLRGTDTLDVIGGINTTNAYAQVVKNGYNDAKGWWCENGKTAEGDSVALSTNRCLLIRKNTVKSGLNAVAKNKDDFVTLCEEWVGEPVETGDEVTTSCKGFTYVSTFDYTEHYSSTIDLENSEQPDGTSKIDITNLNSHSCDELKITLYDGNNGSTDITTHIPIMVFKDSMSSDIPSDCDVIVMHGATLNINNNLTSKNVTVYPGSRLIIPSGKTYTANSLTLRRDNDSVPYFLIEKEGDVAGNVALHGDSSYYFDLRTDGTDWRWVTLPAEHKVSNIKMANGKPINLNKNVWVSYYDGEYRAQYKSSAWRDVGDETDSRAVKDTTFKAGEGFLFGISGNLKKKIYRFKFANTSVNDEKFPKPVGNLHAWGGNDENLKPNHKGWNMIGNPFTDNDTTDIIEPIRVGVLKKEYNKYGQWTGGWLVDTTYLDGKKLRYAVIPVLDRTKWDEDITAAGGYKSEILDDYVLPPFTSFFVQIGGTDPEEQQFVSFNPVSENPINRIVARETYWNYDDEIFLRIKVGDKKTGCFISSKFTDEYEPGDDLESRYTIYQYINGYKLLYSAINDSIIEQGIKVYAPSGNVHLDGKTNINNFDEINVLYDNHWYDLLHGQTIDIEKEFILQAKRKKDNYESYELIYQGKDKSTKFIEDGNLYILNNNCIFNMLGERVK